MARGGHALQYIGGVGAPCTHRACTGRPIIIIGARRYKKRLGGNPTIL